MTSKSALALILFILVLGAPKAFAQTTQTTSFTYQGRLTDASAPASGTYDFQFALFNALGDQIGTTQTLTGVIVTAGSFTVQLDFGDTAFPGADRFLEIRVKRAADATYWTLTPRQRLTSTPYAIRAADAEKLDGVDSAGFIRNQAAQQTANLNISGTATATTVSAATQFNIGANRVLSISGSSNLFAGVGAGAANTTGFGNAFFGRNAGASNTTGFNNSFVGALAGLSNTTGSNNSFFGHQAGRLNTTGSFNSFFGADTGFSNTEGMRNSFFGLAAGVSNTTGFNNSFFGAEAGSSNTTGNGNAFVGASAGLSNTTGFGNVFVGLAAGVSNTTGVQNSFFGSGTGNTNTTGSNNTLIGVSANVASGDLTFATAIGSQATVSASNTIALGRSSGADKVVVYGLGAAGATPLCRNASNEIATCSSSLRYKSDVQPFVGGLSLIYRLRPITFTWKDSGVKDVGFAAEEVEQVEPLLTFRNDKGEIEGVKYAQISAVLINAVKEQQAQIISQQAQLKQQAEQIETQQRLIERQQQQFNQQQQRLEALQKLVCSTHRKAKVCN